jgi:Anti-sigma factor NepR
MVKLIKEPKARKDLAMKTIMTSNARPQVHDIISIRLRSYYSDAVNEPLPSNFELLLQQLEKIPGRPSGKN